MTNSDIACGTPARSCDNPGNVSLLGLLTTGLAPHSDAEDNRATLDRMLLLLPLMTDAAASFAAAVADAATVVVDVVVGVEVSVITAAIV